MSDAKDNRTARAVGGPKVVDRVAECVFESVVAAGDFLTDASGGLPGEPGMRHGVVADEMSRGRDGAGDLRALTDVVADEKETGADVEAGQDIKESFGDDIVGTVVVSEGDLVWVWRGDKNFAEDLRLCRQCGVSAERRKACGSDSRRRDCGSVHCLELKFRSPRSVRRDHFPGLAEELLRRAITSSA